MSIDKNFGSRASQESLTKAAEAELCSPESAEENDERLAEVVEAIKGEFSSVVETMSRLEGVEIDENALEKLLFVADRLSTLAEVSPALAGHPEIRREFDAAVRFLATEFARISSARLAASDLDAMKKREFDAALRGLSQSLEALGPDFHPVK